MAAAPADSLSFTGWLLIQTVVLPSLRRTTPL